MKIFDYCTAGGKNLIEEYIISLPANERLAIYDIRNEIEKAGFDAFQKINTRQLRGKLWEIKISKNRIMYVIKNKDEVYFVHACRKQKGKAQLHDINTAISRAIEEGLL